MTINEHASHFMGQEIRNYTPDGGLSPDHGVWRVALDYEAYQDGNSMAGLIQTLAGDEHAGTVTGLVIGAWDFEMTTSASEVIDALVGVKDRFSSLRGIFLGDITYEEQECSWIKQGTISRLLEEFSGLEVLRSRGMEGLEFDVTRHNALKSLAIETGGLPGGVLENVLKSELPALEHLELWIGDEGYGWDGNVASFAPLLENCPFPALKRLGLRNAEIADEIAHAVAGAPVLQQLEELDLSLGVLSDHGAEALLESPAVKKLKRLDLHHHYITTPVMEKLRQLGPEVNLEYAEDPDGTGEEEDRYVTVGE